MIYCCNCRKLSASGSKYCVRCKKSFGGRLCEKGHLSPTDARCCRECGSSELAKPVRTVNLQLPTIVLAWILALLCLKMFWTIVPSLLQVTATVGDVVIRFIFAKPISSIFSELIAIAGVSAWILFCLSFMLPANIRAGIWKAMLPTLRWFWKTTIHLVAVGLKLLVTLVGGREDKEPSR